MGSGNEWRWPGRWPSRLRVVAAAVALAADEEGGRARDAGRAAGGRVGLDPRRVRAVGELGPHTLDVEP